MRKVFKMSHKTVVKIAILMIIVFGAITLLYPRIFAPDTPGEVDSATPVESPPVGP